SVSAFHGKWDYRLTNCRNFRGTDFRCNSSNHIQNITVDDETAPVINTYPADTTVSCSSAVAPADNTSVTATDNCNGTVAITHDRSEESRVGNENRYTITRTHHETDSCR